ncbi:hypothetical protein VP01_1077g9 [Puccinia sorghi]|uniref:ATP-dependent DNA helicase n=1 Tax=Puccinia sorghi TaxID=27349 RepID=A0A0L6VTI2_9BASI|nr:hypothetical protein VP01_1077g9 [Puccinia sorghi]
MLQSQQQQLFFYFCCGGITKLPERAHFYHNCLSAHTSSQRPLIYYDGPVGCSKTFLLNFFTQNLCFHNVCFIIVAFSSVTSLILCLATTAHSGFKITLKFDFNSAFS